MPKFNPPEGWLDFSSFGEPIRDTSIIAIKTPLKREFRQEFTPSQLVDELRRTHKRKLYAVIDLTNTSKYYDPKELTDLGVQYAKVGSPGKQIPSDEVYKKFKDVLSIFLSGCDERSLVAVHCTHGLNRTGYLISRYLIETRVFDVETAIREFNVARGYNIEQWSYLKHLRDGCPSAGRV